MAFVSFRYEVSKVYFSLLVLHESGIIDGLIYVLHSQDSKMQEDGSTSYKSDQQFADHIQGESQAVSAFSKTKTLRQQREFLPIYAAREQVRASLNFSYYPLKSIV